MTTAADIITLALKDAGIVGVGQTPNAEDSNDALTRLNSMLALWQRRRWLVWHLVDVSKVSTGAQSYTVTTGGDFNVARPDRLEDGCFVRQVNTGSNQPDYPLELIESREDYNQICLKTLTGGPPGFIFYDAAMPTGRVYPWPIPPATIYEIHIALKEQLGSFANLAAAFSMPPEYEEAIRYNLAIRLRSAYQMDPDEILIGLAASGLNTIRNANAQIPSLRLPATLRKPVGAGGYNIYSNTGG
jgi:hypothetical protein